MPKTPVTQSRRGFIAGAFTALVTATAEAKAPAKKKSSKPGRKTRRTSHKPKRIVGNKRRPHVSKSVDPLADCKVRHNITPDDRMQIMYAEDMYGRRLVNRVTESLSEDRLVAIFGANLTAVDRRDIASAIDMAMVPIASNTKVFTAYTLYSLMDDGIISKDDIVTVSRAAVLTNQPRELGTYRANDRYSVDFLIAKMLGDSNNQAAMALAEYAGQKLIEANKVEMSDDEDIATSKHDAFVGYMQDICDDMGINARLYNPHGNPPYETVTGIDMDGNMIRGVSDDNDPEKNENNVASPPAVMKMLRAMIADYGDEFRAVGRTFAKRTGLDWLDDFLSIVKSGTACLSGRCLAGYNEPLIDASHAICAGVFGFDNAGQRNQAYKIVVDEAYAKAKTMTPPAKPVPPVDDKWLTTNPPQPSLAYSDPMPELPQGFENIAPSPLVP